MSPPETTPCRTCGEPATSAAAGRCDRCRQVEHLLPDYLRTRGGLEFVRACLLGHAASLDGDGVRTLLESAEGLVGTLRRLAACDRVMIHRRLVHPAWKGDARLESLVARVAHLEAISGWLDGRKNPMRYSGHEYDLDGVTYAVTKGSSWCSNFFCVGTPANFYQRNLDGSLAENLHRSSAGGAGPHPDPLGTLEAEGVVLPHEQVAYLLAGDLL